MKNIQKHLKNIALRKLLIRKFKYVSQLGAYFFKIVEKTHKKIYNKKEKRKKKEQKKNGI